MQVLGDAVDYLCAPAKLVLCMPDCATDTPIEQRHLYIRMESDGEMRLRTLALQATDKLHVRLSHIRRRRGYREERAIFLCSQMESFFIV